MKKSITRHILTGLFAVLYCCVGFVSVYHSIEFFSLANKFWLGVILASSFEIGQAAVLFSLLTMPEKKVMPWILMCVLTTVQILGNVYASFKYMIVHSSGDLHFFTDSILFFVKNPNPAYNNVMISYITGAILPIVALCMTGMVVNMMNDRKDSKKMEIEEEIKKETSPKIEEPLKESKLKSKEVRQNPKEIKEKSDSILKQVMEEVSKPSQKQPPISKPIETEHSEPTREEKKEPDSKKTKIEQPRIIDELHPNTIV